MKRIIIIGLVILLSVGNVSAVPEHINWDCDQYNALQTGDINWTKTDDKYYGPDLRAYVRCSSSYSMTEDMESVHCKTTGAQGEGTHISSLTSDLIDVSDVDSISIWFLGTGGGSGSYHAYAYIRLLNSTDAVLRSTKLVQAGSATFFSNYYICSNVSIYDGRTWYCNNISVVEDEVKIQIYLTGFGDFNGGIIDLYTDMIRFNEICNVTAPNPPVANSMFYLYDDCGNLLQNPTTTIFVNAVDQIYQGNDNPVTINQEGNYEQYDQLNVIIDTHDMAVEKIVYADDEFNTYNLVHNHIGWDLQVFVYDNFTFDPIEFVKVSVNQACRINDYPIYTYGLTSEFGFVTTYQMSNQNFTIECEKTGYNDYYKEFVANFDAWNGTYFIKVYLDNTSTDDDGNETLPDTPCSTAWSNNDNLIISEINDTEDARLHYMAGDSTTVLYLERWNETTDSWLMVGTSITLDPHERDYIQYTSVNWTEDKTTIYRGRLWGSNCYCDDTSTLTVWNSTDENATIYENLTANIRFLNTFGGYYVNPNSRIEISAYAASNNTSLLTMDLELYNESVKVDSISLTFFDWYVGDDFKALGWEPEYEYSPGFNYTVKMIGFNGFLLAIDHVYANATDGDPYYTGNTLSVYVEDNHGTPLTHSTVYIEEWGSITTGVKAYARVTGLPNDDIQYKATKSGYISSGWATVTLFNSDESVICVLVAIESTSVIGQKMSDTEIKSIFIPLMYLLFIFIILGAFKYSMESD